MRGTVRTTTFLREKMVRNGASCAVLTVSMREDSGARPFGSDESEGVIVSSAELRLNRIPVNSDSASGHPVRAGKETDTAILRYNRVAMLEAVLSIRDRQIANTRRVAFAAILFLAGAIALAAGIFGWI